MKSSNYCEVCYFGIIQCCSYYSMQKSAHLAFLQLKYKLVVCLTDRQKTCRGPAPMCGQAVENPTGLVRCYRFANDWNNKQVFNHCVISLMQKLLSKYHQKRKFYYLAVKKFIIVRTILHRKTIINLVASWDEIKTIKPGRKSANVVMHSFEPNQICINNRKENAFSLFIFHLV